MRTEENNGVPGEDIRIGVYVCMCGGNISDVIDVDRVAAAVGEIAGVTLAKVHPFMCSDPGQQTITEDIKTQKLNRVVVASCSPFLHELTFRTAVGRGGLNPYLYEHVNIREQGSWSHKDDPDGATIKAIRLIAAAIGKLRYAEPLEQIQISNFRRALVIGGGIAGMRSAVDLGKRGIEVLLVEKEPSLGGWVKEWEEIYPTGGKGAELIRRLNEELERLNEVTVLKGVRVSDLSGFVGNYNVTLENAGAGDEAELREVLGNAPYRAQAGAIIVAAGFEPYKPRAGEFGYESFPGVVTLPEFIEGLSEMQIHPEGRIFWRGRTVGSVAFIHCVGSRQIEGVHEKQDDGKINDYCSRTCCTAIVRNAALIRERFPGVHVYDFYQDIRTYGRGHEEIYTSAANTGVTFLRYHGEQPPVVEKGADGALLVRCNDRLTFGEEIEAAVDMVVLGVGMTPGAVGKVSEVLKLPVGADRFLQEVHPKLRPVEVSVNGVFLAGTAQGPMNIEEAFSAAGAAAAKASILLNNSTVQLDPFKANVDDESCIGCERCLSECVYTGALVMKEAKGTDGSTCRKAVVNPGLCVGCGACVAVCPTRAIYVNGWTLSQYEAMVDGLLNAPREGARIENA
ncbi:MAG: CoB--CoM heterodisulfide reductase iron-sulfur subunit A family protein [Verrucomicrobia bacterium]|nr:CoB--CoM heterodisulfide reductase iron-sulfur subunit A family protein [Verrucomicrobiota bacterium]MCF7708608.1 CoB--CoM heterodisulfide reductase iron-sulfur subunit A family protein [Verrucomicrobiota bacterium]